jgi:single-stranded-DNA-specific exonuclease
VTRPAAAVEGSSSRRLSAAWLPPPPQWVPRGEHAEDAAVMRLANELSLPAVFCRLLAARDVRDAEQARTLLRPRMEQLRDPFGLAGIDAAVERLATAMSRGERILIHGDYDVDGVCSAALLDRTLREWGAQTVAFVPHRLRDGYDLGHAGVRAAVENGAALIVTADCGIVAHEAVNAAAAAGIDVVVTDHHVPGDRLPAAVAVVNPSRPDCTYGERTLAGAGVAFKLLQALARRLGRDEGPLWYRLDLVALATIADLAPLRGENRIFAHFGLRVLRDSRHAGVRALLHTAGVDTANGVSAGQVSHVLAPRLNALGRLGDADRALRLLLADSEADAMRLAEESEAENRRRQALDRETLEQALDLLERDGDSATDLGIALASTAWHPGVIGIVASRVVERVNRPVFLLAIDEATGMARGSGRSIQGVHLLSAVQACASLLERYGGHRQAAGLDIAARRLPEFRTAFSAAVRAQLEPDTLLPRLAIDLEAPLAALDERLLRYLPHLGPFGMGNPTPTFAARNVRVAGSPRSVGNGHLRLMLEQDGTRLPAIGFGMAERYAPLARRGAVVDVAFQLQEDRWRGAGTMQARLLDLRPCAS